MTLKELKEKSAKELKALQGELNLELFQLKMKKNTGQLEKTHRLKEIKKDLARILTLKNMSDAKGEAKA